MGRRRSWTDEALVSAVETSRSWGDVVRKVGLEKGNSAYRTVQGHVARLGLDVSHLPTPGVTVAPDRPGMPPKVEPPISQSALAQAIRLSTSWAGVLRKLGRDVGAANYRQVQRAATEWELDTSNFTGQGWASCPVEAADTSFTAKSDERNLHRASAALATAWFLLRGYMVSIPVEQARYDLVVESDAGLARVQVKSTITRDRNRWIVNISRQRYDKGVTQNANGARIRSVYQPGEVDLFFIVTGDASQYLIPLTATNGVMKPTLDAKYAAYKVA